MRGKGSVREDEFSSKKAGKFRPERRGGSQRSGPKCDPFSTPIKKGVSFQGGGRAAGDADSVREDCLEEEKRGGDAEGRKGVKPDHLAGLRVITV